MNSKIEELFKYRKLPILLNYVDKDEKKSLLKDLYGLQKAIYNLDSYLEENWKLKEKKLKFYWEKIYDKLYDLNINSEEAQTMTSHIRRYQLHESQLREGKLPSRLNIEYYYYYKSCDVRLMREIIALKSKTSMNISDWRFYDLVTEINDDIEDIQEDQKTINGNAFLISLYLDGLDFTKEKFETALNDLLIKSVNKFGKTKDFSKLRIHYFTIKRIIETKKLLNRTCKKISKKGLNKEIKLFKKLSL